MVIRVLVHVAEEGGFWADVPSLPGCFTQADSLSELKKRAKEAIEAYLGIGEEEPVPEGVEVLEIAV